MFLQNTGVDLGAPLLRNGLLGRDLGQIPIDLLRRAHCDQLFKMGAPHSIHAGGADNDNAILPGAGLRRGHRLGTLIQVLVQGVAAVAGQHDIPGHSGALAQLPDKGHTRSVGLL